MLTLTVQPKTLPNVNTFILLPLHFTFWLLSRRFSIAFFTKSMKNSVESFANKDIPNISYIGIRKEKIPEKERKKRL